MEHAFGTILELIDEHGQQEATGNKEFLYVLAGDHKEAMEFGRGRGYPEHRIVPVYAPSRLQGLRGVGQVLYVVGTASDRKNSEQIIERAIAGGFSVQHAKIDDQKVRTFASGATRDTDQGKLDYEGFLSPAVLRRFAEYMNKHRKQSDGKLRASDNWQQGFGQDVIMKSMSRHYMDVWSAHRGLPINESRQDALCALMFNVMAYLHEELQKPTQYPPEAEGPQFGR